MKRTAAAACVVVWASGAAFGQASFTAYFAPGSIFEDVSADCSMVLCSDLSYDSHMEPVISNTVLTRQGQTMQLNPSNWRSALHALDGTGATAWGTSDQLTGGSVMRSAAGTVTYFASGSANDVSADGQSVVGDDGVTGLAFIWNGQAGTAWRPLTPRSGFPYSTAAAVSPGGMVVAGFSWRMSGSVKVVSPARWSAADGALTLLTGPVSAYPRAVSDTGVVVGETGTGTSTFTNPVVWNIAGAGHTLPHAGYGSARSISADGTVIGGFQAVGSASTAVLWIYGEQFVLADLLAAHGVSTAGYTLEQVWGVSADGLSVAGQATAGGFRRAFFATLPARGCPADVGVAGGERGNDGVLDNNDLIAFIDLFFAGSGRADMGSAAGVTGSDGVFDNNDFVAFINEFFAGCS